MKLRNWHSRNRHQVRTSDNRVWPLLIALAANPLIIMGCSWAIGIPSRYILVPSIILWLLAVRQFIAIPYQRRVDERRLAELNQAQLAYEQRNEVEQTHDLQPLLLPNEQTGGLYRDDHRLIDAKLIFPVDPPERPAADPATALYNQEPPKILS